MRFVGLLGMTLLGLSCGAQSAIVITNDDGQGQSQQYFEKGAFVLVQEGQPAFGIDAEGNCWFINDGQRVFDQCDVMFGAMDKMRQDMMAGMSEEERAMMQRMMQSQMPQQASEVVPNGSKEIAGYANECYQIGASHEICVSDQLLGEVQSEMGESHFMELQTMFGSGKGPMGGMRNPTLEAIAELSKKGFPMENRYRVMGMPGMSAALLQHIPEAQRDQIMAQMGAAGADQMQGTQVVKVDKNGTMPEFDLAQYPTVSFQNFMQQMMGGAAGGMMPSQ